MRRRDWVILAALGFGIAALGARFIQSPGYMDADYYYAIARQLVRGAGLSEPFLWNYLDSPAGIPHPSNMYWMPGVSLLAAAAMAAFGDSFRAAQLPSILLTATLPMLVAWLSLQLFHARDRAMMAGMLALFPGFFLAFFLTTDAFALYAWVGAATLFAIASARQAPTSGRWLLAGVLAALCHWIRADGLLMLVVGLAAALTVSGARLRGAAVLVVGYGLIMLPWWARNQMVVGSPFAAGLSRSLWFTDYDDLYAFPAAGLTAARWWASGAGAIAGVRLAALWSNLQTLVVVNGLVFLAPLMALGAWRSRSHPYIRSNLLYLALLLLMMSFVFPFAGPRGGFFHSSTAVMPFLWAVAPVGLSAVIEVGVRRRGWDAGRAGRGFGIACIVLAAMVSLWVFHSRAVAPVAGGWAWQANQARHQAIARAFPEIRGTAGAIAANDPPGLYLAVDSPVIPIPDGDLAALLQAAAAYDAAWVVLEADHPIDLAWLYDQPTSQAGLTLRAQAVSPQGTPVYLFRIGPPGEAE